MLILKKLDYLIEYLLNENTEVSIDKIPTDINEKKNLYRSLCNIRKPKPISKEYLQIENEYLQEELQLLNCYESSLELAINNGIRTIAFPCISTGEFRFPKDEACKLAILAVENFLKGHREDFDKIVFNVYGEEDYKIYERNLK